MIGEASGRQYLTVSPAAEILERVAECELDLALVIRQSAVDERTIVLIGVMGGRTELRMVEDVEQFGSELQCLPLRNPEILEG